MKQIFSLLLLTFLAACSSGKLSKEDREAIALKVDNHNVQAKAVCNLLKSNLDIITRLGVPANSDVYPASDDHTEKMFKNEIARYKTYENFDSLTGRYDTGVTVEKYLSWCKAGDRDPVKSLPVLEVPMK